jgi:hypothetical protein
MKPEDRQQLDHYLDGEIDAQAIAGLLSEKEAVRYLAERAMLITDIEHALKRRALMPERRVMPQPMRWRSSRMALAAAAVLVLSFTAWWLMRPQVIMQRGVGVEILSGEWIGRELEIASGLVELRFRQADASVVIEASFRIVDAKTIRMSSGRITAHVRDGQQGLRVLTPDTDVLDLGTRFAVDVVAGQRSEVHVFEGKVEANARPLIANEALRFTANIAPESRQLRSGTFVQPEEVQSLAAAFHSGQKDRALRAAEALRADHALLALLDFTPASDGKHLSSGEAVHGARWVQGRFPGRRALEFLEADDHVKLPALPHARQFTLMTWLRLDRVPGGVSSILLTDDWQTPGQVHWMMHNEGGMILAQFSQRFPKPEQQVGYWPRTRFPTQANLGSWLHLALVYDAEAKHARFYANGQLDREVPLLVDLPAVLGPAQVGNWNVKDWRGIEPIFNKHDRRLSGRMDELVILSRAMNATEIATYFEATSPYR